MKRILMISAVLSMALHAYAQPDVTSAYNANKQGDFAKAVEYIEKAINDPKASVKEKTWRYRGDIYRNVLNSPDLSSKYPDAVTLCMDSYLKSMELDNKKDYIKENSMALDNLRLFVLDLAIKQYQSNDFCNASNNFATGRNISQKLGAIDTVSIFNGAYCADRCGKSEEALAGYAESVRLGYNLNQSYVSMVDIYTNMGKKDEAKKVLSEARANNPKDSDLLRAEVNLYLKDEKYDQALGLLKDLTIQDPKNEIIWFVLGITCEKLGKFDEQESAYLKAIEINPKYYDALFNLGITYYNKAAKEYNECSKIPRGQEAKYDACVESANVTVAKAIGYFEAAYAEKPTDKEIITALKEAYVRVGNLEGKKRMEDALKK
jgi:tetratricopeptide (TPR) repeat protein